MLFTAGLTKQTIACFCTSPSLSLLPLLTFSSKFIVFSFMTRTFFSLSLLCSWRPSEQLRIWNWSLEIDASQREIRELEEEEEGEERRLWMWGEKKPYRRFPVRAKIPRGLSETAPQENVRGFTLSTPSSSSFSFFSQSLLFQPLPRRKASKELLTSNLSSQPRD